MSEPGWGETPRLLGFRWTLPVSMGEKDRP